LTYGLVISALLFLSMMAVLRFFIPWQRVIGFVQSRTNRLPSESSSKDFSQL
jgi:hypothetical protein